MSQKIIVLLTVFILTALAADSPRAAFAKEKAPSASLKFSGAREESGISGKDTASPATPPVLSTSSNLDDTASQEFDSVVREIEKKLSELASEPSAAVENIAVSSAPYTVGIQDVLEISVLQPEAFKAVVTVSPDGSISFPYIGRVEVKGLTPTEIQTQIQDRLADGFLRYPVVSVSLQESRSLRFFVYGEVIRPGAYSIEENTTVLRAISMAGGFTKFGSSSRVKILRAGKENSGYQTIRVEIKKVMDGDPSADIPLKTGDIVVVSEGIF